MDAFYLIGGLAALVLLVYLLFALFRAEDF